MKQLIEELGSAITVAFESEDYQSRIGELEEQLKKRQTSAMLELQQQAKEQRINLSHTPSGFALAPITGNDEVISPDAFEKLSTDEKEKIQTAVAGLQEKLQKTLRLFPGWQKETRNKVKALNQEIARFAVNHSIDNIKQNFATLDHAIHYLDAVQEDIIEHVDDFRPQAEAPAQISGQRQLTESFQRYQIILLVDRSQQTAAPIVFEDLPTHGNVIGRAEHKAYMGTLTTDFTLIKAGALHRANGGYLVLDARQLLLQPFAYDGLKGALQAREIRIESLQRMLSAISTMSLEPEPIPLEVKVVLYGERLLYYLLYEHDPEFRDLFKVAADFEETVDRNGETNASFTRLIGSLGKRDALRPLDRGAVARVVEHGARLAGDAEKLSTHLRSIGDLLREADYWAGESKKSNCCRRRRAAGDRRANAAQ